MRTLSVSLESILLHIVDENNIDLDLEARFDVNVTYRGEYDESMVRTLTASCALMCLARRTFTYAEVRDHRIDIRDDMLRELAEEGVEAREFVIVNYYLDRQMMDQLESFAHPKTPEELARELVAAMRKN